MWATPRWIGVAWPETRYTPATPAWTGLVLLLLTRLWTTLLLGPNPLSPVEGLVTLSTLLATWLVGFAAWAVLRTRGLAPDAPRAGFDLALWGLVARETSTVCSLCLAVPDPYFGAAYARLPAGPVDLAQWTNALGLVAFGWGMALGLGGCWVAARQPTAPRRLGSAPVE